VPIIEGRGAESTPVFFGFCFYFFIVDRFAWSLFFVLLNILSTIVYLFILILFAHGIVCPSIYGFQLPLWYILHRELKEIFCCVLFSIVLPMKGSVLILDDFIYVIPLVESDSCVVTSWIHYREETMNTTSFKILVCLIHSTIYVLCVSKLYFFDIYKSINWI